MSAGVRFSDACLVAREIFAESGGSLGRPKFPIEIRSFLVPAIEKRLSVDGRHFTIHLSPRRWPSKQFYSNLLRYKTHANIIYIANENLCWRRFVVCKELAHLLLDSEDHHFTEDPVRLVQQLITNVPFSEWDDIVTSEHLATVVAVEMLLPWVFRPDLEALQRAGKSDLEIAKIFRVPEKFIDLMLRAEYGAMSRSMNERLDNVSSGPTA